MVANGVGLRPHSGITFVMVLGLVAGWVVVYSVGVLGSLWRFREPDAPAPTLSVADQWADLFVAAIQLTIGVLALAATTHLRRQRLAREWPPRRGTALDAAVLWCAAIGGASVVAMALDGLDIARFGFSTPAAVQSDWLAVLSALTVGLREEPLLVALPVVLLLGRVPIGVIMALSATMRGVLNLYFGGGGFVWAFLWGGAAVWVFYRYRRLWVLILVHGLVMNIQVLDRVVDSDSAATVLQWINILILFSALLWWLTPRALDAFLPNSVAPRSTRAPIAQPRIPSRKDH